MKKILLFFLIVILYQPLFSQSIQYEYFPLKSGNMWTYLSPENLFIKIIKIDSDHIQNVGGHNYHVFLAIDATKVLASDVERKLTTAYYYKGNELIHFLAEKEHILLQFPLQIGREWSYDVNGVTHNRIIKRKMTEKYVVGKNYSDVIEIKHTIIDGNRNAVEYEYYAKGFGLILREVVTEENNTTPFLILDDFININ